MVLHQTHCYSDVPMSPNISVDDKITLSKQHMSSILDIIYIDFLLKILMKINKKGAILWP